MSDGFGVSPVGRRLREFRQGRKLTQRQLADRAGLSQAFISYVERGDRRLDRRSDLAAVAAALQVTPEDLMGIPRALDISSSVAQGRMPALADVLMDTALGDAPDVLARPVEVLADVIAGPLRQARYRQDDFSETMRMLPGLLAELHVQVAAEDERAAPLLVETCTAAALTARHLGHTAVAWIAAQRAQQAAQLVDDPVLAAQAAFAAAHARPAAAKTRALAATAAAADRLDPLLGGSAHARQVAGMLHLSAALHATMNGRSAAAAGHLDVAEDLASRQSEPAGWQNFGPANLIVWQVLIAVEAGDPARALTHADRIENPREFAAALPSRGRRAAFYLERARAHASVKGHDGKAFAALRHAERIAPERIRESPVAQGLAVDLRGRPYRTREAQELRAVTRRMRLPG